MGRIKNQSLYTSLIQIIGAVIGAMSTIFIYPKNLSLYGVYGFLTNTASLLVPLISLGFGSTLLKYFPFFNNKESRHNGFFGFIYSAYAIGILVFSIVFIITYPFIYNHFKVTDPILLKFLPYILPLTVLYVLQDLGNQMCINFQFTALPALLSNVMKLILPLLFIGVVLHIISELDFIHFICGYYILVILSLFFFIKSIGQLFISPPLKLWNHEKRKEMTTFAIFSILGGVAAVLAMRIDSLMITSMLGTETNGLFILAAFISNVCFIPALAFSDILSPQIAEYSKKEDSLQLKLVYGQSAILMLITTLWIVLCIWINFTDLSSIMPNSDKIKGIWWLVFWLCLARIFDAGTGVNHQILAYSKYYKQELVLLTAMVGINLCLNFLFIQDFGANGVAFSTFISIALFNISKSILVWIRLALHPFQISMIVPFGLFLILFFIFNSYTVCTSPYLNMVIKSIMVTVIYFSVLFCLKISPEFNDTIRNYGWRISRWIRCKP